MKPSLHQRVILPLAAVILSFSSSLPAALTPEWDAARVEALASEARLPAGGEESWALGTLPKDRRVALRITARRHSPAMGGYGHYVRYFFDGKPLNAAVDRYQTRLLNKAAFFTRPDRSTVFWNQGDGVWHTFFSPDFKTDTSRYGVKAEQEPYTIVLEVTDLLNEGGDHRFSARNLVSPAGGKEIPVFVSVEALVGPERSKDEGRVSRPALQGKPSLTMGEGGGFELVFGSHRFPVESRYSFPNGDFHYLRAASSGEGERQWKPVVEQKGAGQWTITANAAEYRLERTITLHEHRVSVEETLTNLGSEPLAIRQAHYLKAGRERFPSCRIGGPESEAIGELYSPTNPTLFFPLEKSALGLVIEDDVQRNQSLLYYDTNEQQAGFSNDLFALPGKAAYTSQWSIYFQPSDDYFDFINTVRRDWGANITLKAPVYFASYRALAAMEEEALAKLLALHSPEYLVFWELRTHEPSPQWDNKLIVANGPGIHDPVIEGEMALLREAIAKVRNVAPRTKISLYTHCFFISPQRAEDERYQDSWILNSDGTRKQSVYRDPQRLDFQTVYPTLENSYGKDYLKLVDFYLNDLGLDWLYWDESNGPGVTHSDISASNQQSRWATYGIWDGHSADIHRRKKTIETPFALLPLITRPIYAEIMKRVEAKGGFILFNSAATTRQRLAMPSFSESQDTLTRAYETHLNTPLAYGYGNPTMEDLRARLGLGLLYARTFLDYPSEVVAKCYPFTSEELHAGWLKGKERIITMLDGEYGWGEAGATALLYLFDQTGALAGETPVTLSESGKTAITVPLGGIAILERR